MIRTVLLQVILVAAAVVLVTSMRPSQPALAFHHLAEISEVMSGFDGDANVQYVEINMRSALQYVVRDTRLTTFDDDGSFRAVLLLIGDVANLPNHGDGVKWIMGSPAFQTASGITPDFTFDPTSPSLLGAIPQAGMICWGAPTTTPPQNPNSWDHTDPNNYVDCVKYGGVTFSGPPGNNATSLGPGDCQSSLTRTVPATFDPPNPTMLTGNTGTWADTDSANDFALAVPSPENNAGTVGKLNATDTDGDTVADCRESPPVGGIAELPDVAGTPLETGGSSGPNAGVVAGVVAAVAAGAVVLGGAAWYTRMRWTG